MSERRCRQCGSAASGFTATFCVRCGAELARGAGLEDVSLAAWQATALGETFSGSQRLPARGGGARPIAWTGFGTRAALLSSLDAAMVLEMVELDCGDVQARSDRLADDLGHSLLSELLAPPLAGRIGIMLADADVIRFYPYDESAALGGRTWRAAEAGERIHAAAITGSGELFVLAGNEAGELTVRDCRGRAVSRFEPLGDAKQSFGFAAQGRAGRASFYVWSEGVLVWRSAGGAEAEPLRAELTGLRAPAPRWLDRLTGDQATPHPWLGARDAVAGAYPMIIGDGQTARFGALVVGETPSLVPYAREAPKRFAVAGKHRVLSVDEVGYRVVNALTGALIAERREPQAHERVHMGLSSGDFLSLESKNTGEIMLVGWTVRGDDLALAWQVELRAPKPENAAGRPSLRATPELAPLEIDNGLAIGLEEFGAGVAALRVWCEAKAFRRRAA